MVVLVLIEATAVVLVEPVTVIITCSMVAAVAR